MRPIPILTAILVTATLYLLVMERDALFAFATSGEVPSAEELTDPGSPATAEDAPVPAAETMKGEKAVKVVAIRSTAQTIDSAVILRDLRLLVPRSQREWFEGEFKSTDALRQSRSSAAEDGEASVSGLPGPQTKGRSY